jgi:hypothetical protein
MKDIIPWLPFADHSRSVAIINDTGGRGHYGCDLVMARLRQGLAEFGFRVAWTHPVGVDWRPIAEEILLRPPVDAVVVNGEGSIHHSATRPRAVYLPAIGPFVRQRMGIAAFLVNATITAIDDAVARDLEAFDKIFVRDRASREELAQFGIIAHVVPDLTIGAELPCAQKRSGVCVTDSILDEARAALLALSNRKGWIHRPMHNKQKQNRNWWPWRGTGDYHSFARLLSRHELVVTGRLHTVTMCIATSTPFVAVESNTPKIAWLLDDVFGRRDRLVDLNALATLDYVRFAGWSDWERDAVRVARKRAARRAKCMFKMIAAS